MLGHNILIKFDFIKNKNKDFVKKMPIHALKVWAHELTMVIVMLEDPHTKQVVGLVYSINKINYELSQTSVDKGFKFKDMKAKIAQDVHDCQDEFFEVLQIEKDKSAKDSQRAFEWAMTNFEGSSKPCPTKKPQKEFFFKFIY